MKHTLVFSLAICVASKSVAAEKVTFERWSYGAWTVRKYEYVEFDSYGCEVWTGNDGGAGVLAIDVNDGGAEVTITYTPANLRDSAGPMTPGDSVVLIVDSLILPISTKIEVGAFQNDWSDSEFSALAHNAFVTETIDALRAGDLVEVGVQHAGQFMIYDVFSLYGVTATWLKASEWCGFDPDRPLVSTSP